MTQRTQREQREFPPEDESPSEHKCTDCGRTFKEYGEPERCGDCALGNALASTEPPEGGWARGSDMDRL